MMIVGGLIPNVHSPGTEAPHNCLQRYKHVGYAIITFEKSTETSH